MVQDEDSIRSEQHERWSGFAPNWDRLQAHISGMTRPVTEQMVAVLRLRPGARVLDLACGVGNPAFTLAEQVGPEGSVLGLDLTAEMVEAARARACELGVANVTFRQIAAETELGVPDARFDAATCRFGL